MRKAKIISLIASTVLSTCTLITLITTSANAEYSIGRFGGVLKARPPMAVEPNGMLHGAGSDPCYVIGNAIYVRPDCNLSGAWSWIKSASRDAAMGAKSATNRRVVFFRVGDFSTIAGRCFTIDANYIDLCGLSSNYFDCVISRGTGGATILQKTYDTRISNLTFKNTGTASTDYCLHIYRNNSGLNTDSRYNNLYAYPGLNTIPGFFGTSSIDGTWENCEGRGWDWRLVTSGTYLGGVFRFCKSSHCSYAGDAANISIRGKFYYCIGGQDSFGGCQYIGCRIYPEAYFEGCFAGGHSYGMGTIVEGVFINCYGGLDSFAGTNSLKGLFVGPEPGYYGKFRGYARNCFTSGGFSFGMDTYKKGECSGQIIDCRLGDLRSVGDTNTAGIDANYNDLRAYAFYTWTRTGSNNNITIRAKRIGQSGNNMYFACQSRGVATTNSVYRSYGLSSSPNYPERVYFDVKFAIDVNTTAQVCDLINSDANSSSYIYATYEGDGSGIATNQTSYAQLASGVDPAVFKGNCPANPVTKRANFSTFPFDNGVLYDNYGTVADVNVTLWRATLWMKGQKYMFNDVSDANQFILKPPTRCRFNWLEKGALLDPNETFFTGAARARVIIIYSEPNVIDLSSIGVDCNERSAL